MFNKTRNTIKNILENLSNWDKKINGFVPPIWYCLIKTFSKDKNIDISEFEFKPKVKNFLNSLNFYDENCETEVDKILPIRNIPTQEWKEVDLITNEFWDLIKKFLWSWKEKLASNMIKMIWELLNNIAHHSWEIDKNNHNQAFIYDNYQSGQYFDKSNLIQIAIVDAWIWIFSSVRKKDKNIKTAKEAIKKAFEPHFTWWTILNSNWISNAWLWLTVTLEIIKKLKWDMFVWTKDYLYSYHWKKWEEIYEKIPTWKWTFVVLNIYTKEEAEIDIFDVRNKYLNEEEVFDIDLNFW